MQIRRATVGSFADDTKLWQVINAAQGTNTQRQQLQHLYDWEDGNNMHHDGDKSELMRYGKTEDKPMYPTPARLRLNKKLDRRPWCTHLL